MEEIEFLGMGILLLLQCDELVQHGASVGETPAAVVKKCKYTIAMLSDPAAALSVVFDKDGALEQICAGKGYIDMSTVDADTSSKISEAITSKGGSFVEAPALYDQVDVLGKKSFFLGQVGNGAKMKGSMMNAFSEGIVLADKSGLDPHTLLDVLDLGAIANPMFKMKRPAMIKNSYPPAFPLKHQQKDMRLALALGDENAVPMPVAAAANEARSLGLGDNDFSAVFESVSKGAQSST
ncbi:hypothetical protein K7X08_022709 [Anisodus acutangulus]|uniref:Uncharacterized protein n=1 Tax=Anisodus acutangulus TaxID=402998 RepID=A0A9Q1RKL3_9SOLA|nr:hypothetical protein K7X08_022709 [Anisodus acutangulus]